MDKQRIALLVYKPVDIYLGITCINRKKTLCIESNKKRGFITRGNKIGQAVIVTLSYIHDGEIACLCFGSE